MERKEWSVKRMDREKVISTLEEIKTQTAEIGLDSAVIAHKFIDKIIALLKEQEAETELCDKCGRRRLKSKWERR